MELTEIERNVVLVALDHMEEHLDAIETDTFSSFPYNLMDLELYLKRVKAVKAVRFKIQKQKR